MFILVVFITFVYNFYVSTLGLKSIFSFGSIQFENEIKERK